MTNQGIENKLLLRKDLHPPESLKQQFYRIRNLLAGQAEGMTLDQSLVNQLIDILLCKMHDEKVCRPEDPVRFQWFQSEADSDLFNRMETLLDDVMDLPEIGSLFENGDTFSISPQLLREIVQILQGFEFTNARRDVIGEAFEVFIGPSLRGNEGQFFTPRNVVELTCDILNPKPDEIILDPACGTGGFLTQAIRFPGTDEKRVFGIDKDSFLAKVAAIQIGLLRSETDSWAFSSNSLDFPYQWPSALISKIQMESVDVIMTNPPFGSKISVGGNLLIQYRLGHKWQKSKNGTQWFEQPEFAKDRPPQILFIERCLGLLKPGGRLGIVIPDSILGNVNTGYVRTYIKSLADVVAIIDLPLETFLPSTSTKTSLLFLRKKSSEQHQEKIFMGIASKCGHDRRGKPLYRSNGTIDDDLPLIGKEFREWSKTYAPDF